MVQMDARALRKEFEEFKKEAQQKYDLAIQRRNEALAQHDADRVQCSALEFDANSSSYCIWKTSRSGKEASKKVEAVGRCTCASF